MLRVFVYEYTSACDSVALGLPESLQIEGWAMLSAVLKDFCRIPGLEVCTLLHRRNMFRTCKSCRTIRTDDEPKDFRRLARSSDYTLIIAPELDQVLYSRCRIVEDGPGRLLGPSAAAVQLTGDKLECGKFLRHAGVATPECFELSGGSLPDRLTLPAVCKPRYGAGSFSTWLVRDPSRLPLSPQAGRGKKDTLDSMQAGRAEKHILQPFVLGLAVSVAFIISAKECVALLPAEQHLSEDGRFRYLGGAIPLAPDIAQRAEHLARRALETIPGLLGFVGVDLVLGEKGDGSEDWVIEINPRLTTSYIGQRLMTPSNLAQSMLQAASGSSIEPLEWLDNRVTFRSDGSFQMTA